MNTDIVTIFIDIICTVWEGMIGAYLFRTYATKRIPWKKDVLWVCFFVLLAETLTFSPISSIIKIVVELFLCAFIIRRLYKISMLKGLLSMLFFIFSGVFTEMILTTGLGFLFSDLTNSDIAWQAEYYLIYHILMLLIAVVIKKTLVKIGKNFTKREDLLFSILLAALIFIFMSSVNSLLYGRDIITQISQTVGIIILLAALFLLIYFVHDSARIRLIQQIEEQQLQKLQAQYQYYEERLKDEQRVREIYHDMKNHLLVLQAQLKEIGHTGDKEKKQETEEMIAKLQNQISDYEDYVQTGNAILDVILRDKYRKAKEKIIDFHTEIDFSKGDFIDALDISTIFGNALDNAIEACEKVSEEERFITMKAREKNHFLVIHIENSAILEEEEKKNTKEDTFLHGFGLKNIQRAAEKYGGQYKRNYQNGVYMLSILIPIAEK